ncbi:MiaB/RimO family radical SAM methylthiotransferase [Desulfovibrio sp. OttesenSCG-928-M16]|nr:MiaB/RimO family radical SAM methylthiotransferase [Desulfovibrio sp. OttesenSCG-928-M16]
MTAQRCFHIVTLGCKVNQYESQALREAWLALGGMETPKPREAAVILVNSCAVTARAVADLRAVVRRLRRAAPLARIIVTGCAARLLEEKQDAVPDADLLVLHAHKANLAKISPEQLGRKDRPASNRNPALFPPLNISGYNRSRAVLKIQDGCSHCCTYCFVPLARGPARSRPFAESLAEARRLLDAGFREIVVSGINLRQYREPEGGDFWDFLTRLDAALAPQWAGQARLRISSLEPGQLGQKALDCLASCRLAAPHLHISLQSGSASVLARMGREHYDPADLVPFLQALRGIWPRFGLGADILCGFPGESETEARESLGLIRQLPLGYAHVFPYSRRPGTRAAALPDQLPAELKKLRAAAVRALLEEKQQTFLHSLLDCASLHVVFDQGKRTGVSEHYADCRLLAEAALPPADKAGFLLRVRPLAVSGNYLVVQPLEGLPEGLEDAR